MKSTKIIIVSCMLLTAIAASAQSEKGTISFIPRIGMTLANLTDMDIYVDANDKSKAQSKVGLTIGGDVEYIVMPKLGVSLGAYYSMQGCRNKKVLNYEGGNTTLQYINFPLMLNGYIGYGFALHAGVQLGVKAGEKTILTDKKFFKSTDVSIPLGISYEYERFIIDARYNLGISDVVKSDYMKSKNMVFVLSLGYRI
ncbi:MAG: PorT family protein [Prevotella sp.]|nr:PorT family protein [Prevotella sp.]